MDQKGEEIEFWKGTYKGKTGWKVANGKSMKVFVYVIVDMEDGTEKKTKVQKSSIRPLKKNNPEPKTLAQAVLLENKDIDSTMDFLAEELVKVGISHNDKNIFILLAEKIEKAQKKQEALGIKAVYHKVNWMPPFNKKRTTHERSNSADMDAVRETALAQQQDNEPPPKQQKADNLSPARKVINAVVNQLAG